MWQSCHICVHLRSPCNACVLFASHAWVILPFAFLLERLQEMLERLREILECLRLVLNACIHHVNTCVTSIGACVDILWLACGLPLIFSWYYSAIRPSYQPRRPFRSDIYGLLGLEHWTGHCNLSGTVVKALEDQKRFWCVYFPRIHMYQHALLMA